MLLYWCRDGIDAMIFSATVAACQPSFAVSIVTGAAAG
jgi:hypothetical protein